MGTFGQFDKRLAAIASALTPPAPPSALTLPYVVLDYDTSNAPPGFDVATTPPATIWAMLSSGELTLKDMDGFQQRNLQARQLARRLGIEVDTYCGFRPDDDGVDA